MPGFVLNVPLLGQGYNPGLVANLVEPRNLSNPATGFSSTFPTYSSYQPIADLPSQPASAPPGYSWFFTTYDINIASNYASQSGFDVRRFCSCGSCTGTPLALSGSSPAAATHTWTYAIFANTPQTTVPPPTTPPNPPGIIITDPPPFVPPSNTLNVNIGISNFQSNDTIYTYFDIAMEVRGNTYCAANVNKNSNYRWTPPQGFTFPLGLDSRPIYSLLDGKFGGWAQGSNGGGILGPSVIATQGVPQAERVKINNDGWLIEKVVVNNFNPLVLPNNSDPYEKLAPNTGVTQTVCREGCKDIYYEPVPLPNELPDSQKFRVIDDYFEAYQTVFVRMFQPAFAGSSYRDGIDWKAGGINTKGQKLQRANKKFAEFLAKYYAPINKTASPSNGSTGQLPNTYRYTPMQIGFFLDFSTCDGYVGENWNGQTSPYALLSPGFRTIYFRNGTTIEIEGAVSIFHNTVQTSFWKEFDNRKFGIILFDVNESMLAYVMKRTFKYKIKIPVYQMADGYSFELKPKLVNMWTDQSGNIHENPLFPDDTEVLTMVFDPDAQSVIDDRGGINPGPPYLQSNYTFPACYHIHQTPVVLPSPVNNSIRVLDYPNDKSKTTNLIDTIVQSSLLPGPPGYTLVSINLEDNLATYQKITAVPRDQEVQPVKFPTGQGLGAFPDV